jgi:quinol monooxygenase YgiN
VTVDERPGSVPTVLYAEFTALPGNVEAVVELIDTYRNDVRKAPGTMSFAVHRKREDPATFFVYERYASEEDFQAHLTAPASDSFNASLKELVADGGSRLTFLTDV